MIGGLVLRKRSAAECVDLGLALLREEGGAVLRRTALPMAVTCLAVGAAAQADPAFALVLAFLLSPALGGPALRVAVERTAGADPGRPHAPVWRDDLRASLDIFRQTLWLGPFCAIPTVVILPIGLWFWSGLLFLPEVRLVERAPLPFTRLRDLVKVGSGRMFTARMWQVALYLFGAASVEGVGQMVTRDLLQLGSPWGTVEDGQITPWALLGVLLCGPIWAMIRFAFYLDLRTRAEHLDVFFALWHAAGGQPQDGQSQDRAQAREPTHGEAA